MSKLGGKRSKRVVESAAEAAGEPAPSSAAAMAAPVPADRPNLFSRLPSELVAFLFGKLPASDVGRCALVCKDFHALISEDSVAWTYAITELDPFCALGPARAWSLFHRSGDGWLRAAASLATRVLCEHCENVCIAVDCGLDESLGGQKVAGPLRHCHCRKSGYFGHIGDEEEDDDEGPDLFDFERKPDACLPLINRWMYNSIPCAHVDSTQVEDPANELRKAMTHAPLFATISLCGTFDFADEALVIRFPLRLLGGNRTFLGFIAGESCLSVRQTAVMLEGLRADAKADDNYEWDGPSPPPAGPCVDVCYGGLCLATDCAFNSAHGTALMVGNDSDGSRGCLLSCKLSSEFYSTPMCLGIVAKSYSEVSCYGCTFYKCMWGVFAGVETSKLVPFNTWVQNDTDISPNQYPQYTNQIVQPWAVEPPWTRRLHNKPF